MNTQKNKAKIIKELLHSTDKELTDEELMSEILSTNVSRRKNNVRTESGGRRGEVCGQLGVYFQFYRGDGDMDGDECSSCGKGIRRISVYSFESGSVLYRRGTGALDYDEPEPSGGEGQKARRKRLSRKFKKRICNRRTV